MWGKIIILMYMLWLHSLYGLYGPRCPLSPKRLINLISLSLDNLLNKQLSCWSVERLWHLCMVTMGKEQEIFSAADPDSAVVVGYKTLQSLILVPRDRVMTKLWLGLCKETVKQFKVGLRCEECEVNKYWHWCWDVRNVRQTSMGIIINAHTCSPPISSISDHARSFPSMIEVLGKISLTEKKCCLQDHYSDVIMGRIASQITSLTIVYSILYSGIDQRKHQSSASLAFVRGIHRWLVNSPHKGPVMQKKFPFDDAIMHFTDYWDFRINWELHHCLGCCVWGNFTACLH